MISVRTAQTSSNGCGIDESGTSYTLDGAQGQAVCFKPSHFTRSKDGAPSEICPPLSADADKGDQESVVLAFDERVITSPGNRSEVLPGKPCPTLNGSNGMTIAFPQNMSGTQCASAEDLAPVLQSENPTAIAIQEIGKRTGASTTDVRCGIGIAKEGDPMFTLQAGAQHGVATGYAVRRLTPTECERLQGFPDGHTAGFSDSVRYRMLGNAVAVPVAEWVFRRLKKCMEEISKISADQSGARP